MFKHDFKWTLGAKEIMFTNPITSWFFGNGKKQHVQKTNQKKKEILFLLFVDMD